MDTDNKKLFSSQVYKTTSINLLTVCPGFNEPKSATSDNQGFKTNFFNCILVNILSSIKITNHAQYVVGATRG